MVDDIFLKIGDIKGESVDAKHKGEIDVLSWSWGMSQSGTSQPGGGGGAGRVNMQDLSVTKFCDAATVALVAACCSGKHYKEAGITVRRSGGQPLEYLKISLKDVLVSSQSMTSGDAERVTENITLKFAEFKLEYTTQKPDGTAGIKYSAGWNLVKNVKV